MSTHGVKMTFGKHDGELMTRVPVSYLFWMVNRRTQMWEVAKAELDRRGSVTPEFDITGHAMDRASLHCWPCWRRTMRQNEGIHAWLIRMARDARERNDVDHQGRYVYLGMAFAFQDDGIWPVLKTVVKVA